MEIGERGACLSGSKLALMSTAARTRQVYNFGPTAWLVAADAARELPNYTATPNLINLDVSRARSVSRSVGGLEVARSVGQSVISYLENSKRVISVPDKNDGGARSSKQLATGTQLKPRP